MFELSGGSSRNWACRVTLGMSFCNCRVGNKKGRISRIMKTNTPDSVLILLLIYLAGLSGAQGQLSPPPDGCYPNFTTAEGCNALSLLTTGSGNTGLGWYALFSNTGASFNTAVGGGALTLNNGDSNTAIGAAALLLNTTGTQNVAIGTDAMVFNDSGLKQQRHRRFCALSQHSRR
jgi:hypothetical protein